MSESFSTIHISGMSKRKHRTIHAPWLSPQFNGFPPVILSILSVAVASYFLRRYVVDAYQRRLLEISTPAASKDSIGSVAKLGPLNPDSTSAVVEHDEKPECLSSCGLSVAANQASAPRRATCASLQSLLSAGLARRKLSLTTS